MFLTEIGGIDLEWIKSLYSVYSKFLSDFIFGQYVLMVGLNIGHDF